jgi:hypothetical protein
MSNKKVIKMYLHSNKESNTDKYIEEFLDGDYDRCEEVPDKFMYALYEVEFDVEVDLITGDTIILKVDGRSLKDKQWNT